MSEHGVDPLTGGSARGVEEEMGLRGGVRVRDGQEERGGEKWTGGEREREKKERDEE